MKDLCRKSFELLRSELILWVPCTCAAVLTLIFQRLEKVWIRGIFSWLSSKSYHSALGGDVVAYEAGDMQHRALMYSVPLGFCKQALEVVAFVVALVVTAKMVGMIVEEKKPDMAASLRAVATEWRGVLVFSAKYLVALGLMATALILQTTSALFSDRFLAVAASKVFLYPVSLVLTACIAWVLIPSAMRLLKVPRALPVSNEFRKLGTILMVTTSAMALALGGIIDKVEAGVMFENQLEVFAVSVANSIVENVPEVFLFIALALLAIGNVSAPETQASPEVATVEPEPAD